MSLWITNSFSFPITLFIQIGDEWLYGDPSGGPGYQIKGKSFNHFIRRFENRSGSPKMTIETIFESAVRYHGYVRFVLVTVILKPQEGVILSRLQRWRMKSQRLRTFRIRKEKLS